MGKCELRYYVGETLVKSGTWPTYVWDAMSPTGEVPEEPGFSWFDQMMDAAARAVNASDHPPQISDKNTWLVWNMETSSYVDSGVAAVGGVDVATAKVGQVIHVIDSSWHLSDYSHACHYRAGSYHAGFPFL